MLFTAPAMVYADAPVSITVTTTQYPEYPEYGEIRALGQTVQYTATAHYEGGTPADEDVTSTAVWTIGNSAIASVEATKGEFKAKATGDTDVTATIGAVSGNAMLSVSRPGMWVSPGKVGESTNFDLWAQGCNGLTWSLVVNNGVEDVLSLGGKILDPNWNNNYHYVLPADDYTATFSVGGTEQQKGTFSVYGYDSSMDVSVGYAGENTTITLNATNSSGKTADFELYKEISTDNWEMIYHENNVPISNDAWSYPITQTLEQGHYGANFWIGNFAYWGGNYDFYVPQPPSAPSAPPKPLTAEEQASLDLSIGQQADLYGKTNIGFTKMLYDNILGRAADDEGLNNWVTALNEGKITLSSVVYNFVFSKELESIISPSSPTEFVTFLYKNVLGRNPDPQGLASWVDNMKNGMSKEDVLLHFIDSGEFKSICTMFGLTQ